ncbi:MAG: hypothetical protein ACLSDQ_02740 [Adlercreutzia equolifaciens]
MAILASIASEAKGDAERAVAISDLPEYLYKTERENKVFFVCSLVDYIARATKNRRSDVVEALGPQRLGRIVELADVYHCDNIDVVSDHFIEEADIGEGVFDNVAAARYAVPSHWDIGKVYKRLVLAIADREGTTDVEAILRAYCSPVSALIDDYNGSFYYDSPEAIYDAYATGSWSSDFCDSDLGCNNSIRNP